MIETPNNVYIDGHNNVPQYRKAIYDKPTDISGLTSIFLFSPLLGFGHRM